MTESVVEGQRFVALLRKSFVDAGIAMLELHNDEAARTAMADFIEHDISQAEMLDIMAGAGRAEALRSLESVCLAELKSQRRVRSHATDVNVHRGRRFPDG